MLAGIYVPIVTPLDVDGRLDLPALERVADDCLAAGAAGLVALGTTGEPATLSDPQREAVVRCCLEVCRSHGRSAIVGAGGNDTAAVAAAVERWSSLDGVDATLSVVPPYTRPSEEGILRHFAAIADRSRRPVVVYNIPFRTGVRLSAEALLELAAHPGIAGVKQSAGVLDDDTLRLLNGTRDFAVLCGDDALLLALLCLGAAGGITASAHLCTGAFVERHARSNGATCRPPGGSAARSRRWSPRCSPSQAPASSRPSSPRVGCCAPR